MPFKSNPNLPNLIIDGDAEYAREIPKKSSSNETKLAPITIKEMSSIVRVESILTTSW
jgi:hypothetical protein